MSTETSSIAGMLQGLNDQYRAITNNLANANTPGFKRTRVAFSQTLHDAIRSDDADTAALEARSEVDFSQGGVSATGAALHVALEGRGFFRIDTPNGPLYTRNGKFRTNAGRQLVDGAGRIVAGDGGGPITLSAGQDASQIQIAADGTLTAGSQTVGRLRVVDFEKGALLRPVGAGCYQAAEGAEEQDAEGTSVRQGYVEDSNVSVVEELIGLLTVTRLYEANIKSVTMEDDRMKNILQVAMS